MFFNCFLNSDSLLINLNTLFTYETVFVLHFLSTCTCNMHSLTELEVYAQWWGVQIACERLGVRILVMTILNLRIFFNTHLSGKFSQAKLENVKGACSGDYGKIKQKNCI